MCGISGVYLNTLSRFNFSAKDLVLAMNNQVSHRGPDDHGVFIDDTNKNFYIGLGHTRLSIIDLENGKQPLFSNDKQKVIVYNGEVYNFQQLKSKYFEDINSFQTRTDTEVVLKLYEKLGIESFSLLEGMYAFSIYDKLKKKIFIARDFFGEKPLYYMFENTNLFWASELKSITKVLPNKREISKIGLNLFFQLTYIPAPYTIYDNIYKLEPGHFLELDCDSGKIEVKAINFDKKVRKSSLDFREAKQFTHDIVNSSVYSRMTSDVKIGTFLSGGVDSSIISYCVASHSPTQIDTFSIGFEKKEFNETDKSRIVARLIKSHHHEFIIKEKDILSLVDHVLRNFDEPFADSSALASFLVALKTSESVKVALTGDGGDEVFGGYNKYYIGKLNRRYTSLVNPSIHNSLLNLSNSLFRLKDDDRGKRFKIRKLLNSIDYGNDFYFNIISLGFMNSEVKNLMNDDKLFNEPLNYYKERIHGIPKGIHDFRNIDRLLSLEGDMLVKVDRTSMLSSIECRSPFLNKDIWDFSSSLPESYLINGWDKKYILKKAFEDYFPKGFLNKKKKGFEVPVGDWLRNSLKSELISFIDKEFLKRQNIFNEDYISTLVNDHINGQRDNTFRVWTFYTFQKWFKNENL